jgi:hypothetical protein
VVERKLGCILSLQSQFDALFGLEICLSPAREDRGVKEKLRGVKEKLKLLA